MSDPTATPTLAELRGLVREIRSAEWRGSHDIESCYAALDAALVAFAEDAERGQLVRVERPFTQVIITLDGAANPATRELVDAARRTGGENSWEAHYYHEGMRAPRGAVLHADAARAGRPHREEGDR